MYHLYIIKPLNRTGFGICSDKKDRNKKYTSHVGEIVKFSYVWGGLRTHAKVVERTIKQQFVDNTWQVGEWKTEWLDESITVEYLKEYVEQLIKDRHYRLDLINVDYDLTQET
jgi:hypothetical protein